LTAAVHHFLLLPQYRIELSLYVGEPTGRVLARYGKHGLKFH
jgi:hypothetical protein